MSDDATAGRPSWRERAGERRERTRARRLSIAGIVIAIVAWGTWVFVTTRPDPSAELTEASKALVVDWPTMPVDELCSTWFAPNLTADRRGRLDRIFAKRGWTERRPAIRYVLDEMRADELKGRSEYEIDGFPEDRRLKVFWNRVDGRWRVSAPTIPILKEK